MKMIKCLAMAAVAAFSLLFLTSQGPQVVVAAGEQCGTQAGGALCPVGYCCSQYGYCGTTDAYCGNDCQSQCNGEQCGKQAGGAVCPEGLCCSQYGFCGTTNDYCVDGCQSQCTGGGGGGGGGGGSGDGDDLSNLITKDMFEKMFPKRDDNRCSANGFYKYEDFIEAAKAFEGFGTTGDNETRKREIAAFFGQTSHETNGGWPTADGGPYAWGYCFVREVGGGDYCVSNAQWPCATGQQYYGRGPIQLSYNYNYGAAGDALGLPLLANPDLVATNGVISFKTAIWFWMTAQSPKPSCHSVITGSWVPSSADVAAGRVPGFGMTTNIINGGLECGITAPDARVESRIGYYKTFCDMYDITYGDNLDCYNQRPFGNILLNTM